MPDYISRSDPEVRKAKKPRLPEHVKWQVIQFISGFAPLVAPFKLGAELRMGKELFTGEKLSSADKTFGYIEAAASILQFSTLLHSLSASGKTSAEIQRQAWVVYQAAEAANKAATKSGTASIELIHAELKALQELEESIRLASKFGLYPARTAKAAGWTAEKIGTTKTALEVLSAMVAALCATCERDVGEQDGEETDPHDGTEPFKNGEDPFGNQYIPLDGVQSDDLPTIQDTQNDLDDVQMDDTIQDTQNDLDDVQMDDLPSIEDTQEDISSESNDNGNPGVDDPIGEDVSSPTMMSGTSSSPPSTSGDDHVSPDSSATHAVADGAGRHSPEEDKEDHTDTEMVLPTAEDFQLEMRLHQQEIDHVDSQDRDCEQSHAEVPDDYQFH